MRPQRNSLAVTTPPVGMVTHDGEQVLLLVKEAALLLETVEDKPSSKPWHPLLTLSLCLAGAFAARTLVHWSSVALANALRNSPAEAIPNARVEKDAPAR